MPRKRSWTDEELIVAVKSSRSYRMVLIKLQLIPAGGNYEQIKRRIKDLTISTEHFMSMGWYVGLQFRPNPPQSLDKLLVENGTSQSYVLKKRLFQENLKQPKCELCGWAEVSEDGRTPVELDHINGDRYDNRIENLRILCPNCHSLQQTHRGRNKKVRLAKLRISAGAGTR